jgi:hypothetical protein
LASGRISIIWALAQIRRGCGRALDLGGARFPGYSTKQLAVNSTRAFGPSSRALPYGESLVVNCGFEKAAPDRIVQTKSCNARNVAVCQKRTRVRYQLYNSIFQAEAPVRAQLLKTHSKSRAGTMSNRCPPSPSAATHLTSHSLTRDVQATTDSSRRFAGKAAIAVVASRAVRSSNGRVDRRICNDHNANQDGYWGSKCRLGS